MMKRIFSILTLTICMIMTAACASNNSNSATPTQTVINDQNNFRMKTKILFINGSENRDGNTSHMAKELLGNIPYDQLNLVDYRVDSLGQHFEGDQFSTVLNAMQQADIIIIGTPVYWHTMSGSLKNMIDRMYEVRNTARLQGKQLYFIIQGAAPTQQSIESTEFIMNRFGEYFGMNVKGMASNSSEVRFLQSQLQK